MTLNWNLNELFNNEQEFYNEIEKVKKQLIEIQAIDITKLNANNLLDILNNQNKIKELTNNILVYGSLMYYKNIKSENCIKLKEIAEKFNNQINSELKYIETTILSYKKEEILTLIKNNNELKIYKQYIENLFRLQEHQQKDNQKITENSNKINNLLAHYNNLLRDIKYGTIEINEEKVEITSSNFSKYVSSKDRETRKQTYLTVNQNFMQKTNEFAQILNNIIKYRNENAKLEKYKTVLEKVLFNENIDTQILDALIKSVNKNLHLIQKYLKIKAQTQNIYNPHLYDFNAQLDNSLDIEYTLEDAIKIIKESLKPLGEDYLEVVDYLLENHIDATPDENKHQSITFSWHTYSFMNYRGKYNDLKNLIHELGHIVNYYLSKNNLPFIYEDSTIFVGETASIINEILLNRYLIQNAKTKEEKTFYLSKEIENYFTSVFKQTMYTEFENQIYEISAKEEITNEILSNKYYELIQKYYGHDITYDIESSIEWTRLGHLYRWSYYPYKYATGLIIASNVVNSLIDKKTLSKEQYIEFLKSGSSKYSLELLKMLNIDLTNLNIIDNGFTVLKDDIEALEKTLIKK